MTVLNPPLTSWCMKGARSSAAEMLFEIGFLALGLVLLIKRLYTEGVGSSMEDILEGGSLSHCTFLPMIGR